MWCASGLMSLPHTVRRYLHRAYLRRDGGRRPMLDLEDARPRASEGVGVEAERVDTPLDKERSEVRVVAGRLPADAHLARAGMRHLDEVRAGPLDRLDAFVEERRQRRRIPVDAQGQLREVVRADGEAVEQLSEGIGHQDV